MSTECPVAQPALTIHDDSASPLTVSFHTLGCKTNQLETSTIAETFRQQGWEIVPLENGASLTVINTCTVTEKSDQESRRIIRRAKLANPEGRIAVTGCYAQVAPDELAAQNGVNYVIGNNFKDQIFDITQRIPATETPWVQVGEIDKSRIVEGASQAAIGRTRGSLKIQDGCDYKCTYCIIWEARGLSRSLPAEDILHQLTQMVQEGFQEVVLTGINIGQYQNPNQPDQDLAGLLQHLCQSLDAMTPKTPLRLRLTSLDPLEVTDNLIQVIADSNGRITPHIHLSAQSAEDVVLKRMARRHHVKDFEHVCHTLKRLIPHASLGSDIIVGFPGETAERFESTYQVLEKVPMDYFHVFSYSKRKGTPAASFEDQVPEREKKERARRLIALSEEKHRAFCQEFMGKTLQVIVEESLQKGMSENYLKVYLDANGHDLSPNDLVQVQVTDLAEDGVSGQVTSILCPALQPDSLCTV